MTQHGALEREGREQNDEETEQALLRARGSRPPGHSENLVPLSTQQWGAGPGKLSFLRAQASATKIALKNKQTSITFKKCTDLEDRPMLGKNQEEK